jgi:AcrR family transcriptional regulator
MSETRRAGRWRTGQQSRQRIVEAARERFMRDGYEQATVRRIASDAGVDVAMVYYFFGNKEGLFTASVVDVPEHPLHQLAMLLDEGGEHIGRPLVRRFHRTQGQRRHVRAAAGCVAFGGRPKPVCLTNHCNSYGSGNADIPPSA